MRSEKPRVSSARASWSVETLLLTVTSTTVARRRRPHTSTACAPNTYHRAPMACNATARSARSSAGPADDGTQSIPYALMDQEIVEAVLARGPARTKPLGMSAHLVRDGEQVSGRAAGLERVPGACLRLRNRPPVSTRELPHRVVIHAPILASARVRARVAGRRSNRCTNAPCAVRPEVARCSAWARVGAWSPARAVGSRLVTIWSVSATPRQFLVGSAFESCLPGESSS